MTTTCDQVTAELSELVDGDRDAIARHADHLTGCEACRDARHDATRIAALVGAAGLDHAAPDDLAARVLAALDREPAGLAATARLDHASDASNARAALASPRTELDTRPGVDPDVARRADRGDLHPGDAVPARGDRSPDIRRDDDTHLAASPRTATRRGWYAQRPARVLRAQPGLARRWPAGAAAAAVAAVAVAAVAMTARRSADPPAETAAAGPIGTLARLERAGAAGTGAGLSIHDGASWRPLAKDEPIPAGAELRTDERTRAALALSDGTQLVIDHLTTVGFAAGDPRRIRLTAGRLAADLAGADQPTAITTPSGRIDVAATAPGTTAAAHPRFSVTATDQLTSVQVLRDAVVLANQRGERDDVRAGEEGVIERGALAVSAAPGLARDAAWSELAAPAASDQASAGLGALRAYKPGESRDRDFRLALARHDVKIRVVGPIARTEVTETFRNDSAAVLEGVYQFPLPPDAQIDGLALDVAGGFVDGAFVDKERGAKIWRGVIDRATPRTAPRPSQEIIWVEGRWRDPALLDWKRGGRFELRVYPIPAHGARTIKLAYTQVVTPRGAWRQYSYPLPHSRDGSTVADQFTVDVELRGAGAGGVRTAGYDLVADPARQAVHGLTLRQSGFVPRGDLVIDYRADAGDAELRAWTFAGGAAAAPDDKLAAKQHVGIDPKVVEAQRAVAADLRPTAVLALRPHLPRWRDGAPRDYLIVVDDSQSMVGERYTRATELAAAIVAQMDRRDRFGVLVCDSECRAMGEPGATGSPQRSQPTDDPADDPTGDPADDPAGPRRPHRRLAPTAPDGGLRSPSLAAAGDVRAWLARQEPAGASDLVAALRDAGRRLGRDGEREPQILYIGDGFASTGFRRVGDVERAIASEPSAPRITTIGIGSDADAAVLQAAARGGGGSYLAWLPGERTTTAAAAALESTLGTALRDAVVELPAGLADVAPSILPTVRAGEEVLIAARMTSADVAGDVIVRGRVAGQPFEQRYPLRLAASTAAGNGFVPRLWASLAIDQLERTGTAADRARIVALSQGFGVMSRETSLLVLESQAMFDAFGVDRHRSTATWTGEDALDEVASAAVPAPDAAGILGGAGGRAAKGKADGVNDPLADPRSAPARPISSLDSYDRSPAGDAKKANDRNNPFTESRRAVGIAPGRDWIRLRRTWVRVPSVTTYDRVHPMITEAVRAAELALDLSPDSRERHRALVQALSYAGELGRARDIARRWLDRDQLDPQALGALADLLGRDGQRDRALRTLAGLVDLDPDRIPLHERLIRAYEQVGRLAHACAHRIAIAQLQPAIPAATAGALRCLRTLGRERDAQLVLAALPDDAARAAAAKAALVPPLPAPVTGDLVVVARWDAGIDLDVALITPDGARVSWMGGKSDVVTADVTARDRESLALKALRRGNYLLEISRVSPAPGLPGAPGALTPGPPIRGTLDITALGAHRSIPFELTAARAVVGRVSVRLEERFEDLDGTPVQLYNGPGRRILPDRP